jgi:hypothetical protein
MMSIEFEAYGRDVELCCSDVVHPSPQHKVMRFLGSIEIEPSETR